MLKEFRQSKFIQLCFIASVVISITAIYFFDQYSYQQKRLATQKIASSYVSHIRNNLNQTLSAVYPVAALIRTQNGNVSGFTELATEMLPLYPGLAALQLQPDGIVQYVVPLTGNEGAIGHNILDDPNRSREAVLARDTGKLTLAGPFDLIQGGIGAAARLAIYIDNDKGKQFWGFATALISFPDILNSVDLASLTQAGIAYQLSRVHPDSGKIHIIANSNISAIDSPEFFEIQVPNGIWTFQASPINGWRNYSDYIFAVLLTLIFCFLTTVSAHLFSRLKINHQKLELTVLDRTKELEDNINYLEASESRLEAAQLYARIGYWELLADKKTSFWSKQMYPIFGLEPGPQLGHKSLTGIISKQDLKRFKSSIDQSFQSGKEHRMEYTIIHANTGQKRWIDCRAKIVRDKLGNIKKLSGFIQDITERREAEEQLKLSSRVFTESREGITITDNKGIIIDINPAFSAITGYQRDEIIGQSPFILNPSQKNPEFFDEMRQSLKQDDHWKGEFWNKKKNGDVYAELLSISTLKDDNDNIINYVGIFSDITDFKKQQEKLNLMAHYDVLTNLPNRALFSDRFQQAIAHSKRTKHQLAICYLDLDNFKPVNDTYGHEVGDLLLVEVAERISSNLREVDTVSRQGGDEFTLLLNDLDSYAQCQQTLERVHHALAQPYLINDNLIKISASSGVTLYPTDDSDIDTLLRHADQAMYQAKQAGRNRYHLFNAKQAQEVILKHHRLGEIEFALENNELELYYQPKINMLTGKVFGVEALIRWNHPKNGLIPPLNFLPIIEGSELEIQIGDWVINQAVIQLESWQQQNIELEVSVNISSNHLLSEQFESHLQKALAQHPSIAANSLQLEILESSALGDLSAIRHTLTVCKHSLGVNIALDDFGTGYSSLTHLRNLPVDTIKIDQSFVINMLENQDDSTIIDGVIGLAESFDRDVIAEGVETTQHGLMLLLMGCEQAQGYGISKPMPAADLAQWLEHYTANQEWLDCMNNFPTPEGKKIEILRLVTSQWKTRFEENIQSSPQQIKPWPVMDSNYCYCGAWIKKATEEQLFEQHELTLLEQAHEEMHNIANDLLIHYQKGDFDRARDGLSKLQIAFDKMATVLAPGNSSQQSLVY